MGGVRLPNCAVVASLEPVTPKKSRWNCSGLLGWLRLSAMEAPTRTVAAARPP